MTGGIYNNKGMMNNLAKAFKGFNTLLNKIQDAKRPETKKKYEDLLRRKIDATSEKTRKTNLLMQERREKTERKMEEKRQKRLQKQLNAALKRQKKLERERKIQDAKFKKLRKEQELKSRLLSDEEISSIIDNIDNGMFTDELEEKLMAHSQEEKRRKKQLKEQGKEVRDTKKHRKLNEKFKHLHNVFKKTELYQMVLHILFHIF